jgi:hypothetical protein
MLILKRKRRAGNTDASKKREKVGVYV